MVWRNRPQNLERDGEITYIKCKAKKTFKINLQRSDKPIAKRLFAHAFNHDVTRKQK